MTTSSVAKTTAYHGNLADLKGITSTIVKDRVNDTKLWVSQMRESRRLSSLEEWNMAHRAMLESRGSWTSSFHV